MSALRKLASDTALYGLSSIVGRTLNFLLVPFYTGIFAPDEYGIVTQVYAWVAFLNVVYTFGMETTFFRFANRDKTQAERVYHQSQSFLLVIGLGLTAVIGLGAPLWAQQMNLAQQTLYLYLMAGVLWLDGLAALPFARLRLEKKAVRFVTLRMVNIGLNVGLNLLFLLGPKDVPALGDWFPAEFGVGYVFLANLLANGVTLLMLAPQWWPFRWQWDLAELKPMWQYSVPILFMGIAGTISEMLGRTILESHLPLGFYPGLSNKAALGIYGACYKLSVFMSLAIQSFRFAAEPFFFSQAEDKNSPQLYALVAKWFLVVCLVLLLAISLNLDWLAPLFLKQPEYLTGLDVVPILLGAALFLGLYYNLSIWFKLVDKTWWGTVFAVGGALLTVVLNLLLIPVMGYMGSAWATLLVYMAMAIACYWAGQVYFYIPYPLGRMGAYLGLAVGILLLARWWSPASAWGAFAWHQALLLLFIGGVAAVEGKAGLRLAPKPE